MSVPCDGSKPKGNLTELLHPLPARPLEIADTYSVGTTRYGDGLECMHFNCVTLVAQPVFTCHGTLQLYTPVEHFWNHQHKLKPCRHLRCTLYLTGIDSWGAKSDPTVEA